MLATTTGAQWSAVGELLQPGVKHLLFLRHKSVFCVQTVEMFLPPLCPPPLLPLRCQGSEGANKKLVGVFRGRMKRLFWTFQRKKKKLMYGL